MKDILIQKKYGVQKTDAGRINRAQNILTQQQFKPDTDTFAEAFDVAGIRQAEEQFCHYDIFDKVKQGKIKL